MPKKYTVQINDGSAIKKLDSLPERSKGAYITEAIIEKLNRENEIFLNEDRICEIVKREIKKYMDTVK